MKFINSIQTPKSEQQQIILPNIRIRSNTMHQNKQKANYQKQISLNNEPQKDSSHQLNTSRINNIFQMEVMRKKFEQLKVSLSHSTQEDVKLLSQTKRQYQKSKQKTQCDESIQRINEYQLFKRKIDENIKKELKQIQESRQKFMRCVMDTRQRNRSLQIYGDDLTPVINKEKAILQIQKDQKAQQDLLDTIRKQYTQRSPMGNAYCGIKALNKKSQQKVIRRMN
ncbi:unnamed protein product [Paramecium sonneborni]|uniref:Uncharacterized protein n=1 Tax=Paramecium sonneborni TaxID=65129 RepID=A0A8S1Q6A3_9CILI|nr:unnamed protein product [Paramecium sonneborni]